MEKSLYLFFLDFCPTGCNISSVLIIFFAFIYAGEYAELKNYLFKDKKKE